MKSRLLLIVPIFMLIALFAGRFASVSAVATDCASFVSYGDIPMQTSTIVSFDCSADTVVYFGTCDSGNVPNDDLFTMVFNGNIVTSNYYENTIYEYTVLGSGLGLAGTNLVDLNSINSTPYPPATYAYAISPNSGEVVDHLQTWCGADWQGIGNGVGADCNTNVPLFTADAAPTDGTLEMHVLFGNEGSREDEIRFQSWDVSAGEQMNNVYVTNLPAPRYVRIWWQPAGGTDWYLLTSQYWQGGGTLQSEYGVACGVAAQQQASYHTSFSSAVPESDVCFDLINGCN